MCFLIPDMSHRDQTNMSLTTYSVSHQLLEEFSVKYSNKYRFFFYIRTENQLQLCWSVLTSTCHLILKTKLKPLSGSTKAMVEICNASNIICLVTTNLLSIIVPLVTQSCPTPMGLANILHLSRRLAGKGQIIVNKKCDVAQSGWLSG